MEKQIIPHDVNQCQAEKPNENNFMTFGGQPKMVRCERKPTHVITETEIGKDGKYGSMSLCDECLSVAKKQLPEDYFEVSEINPQP